MKTPYGKECRYFYGDYYRGKNFEDCRLINKPNAAKAWDVKYCQDCPVPDILLANACPSMILSASVNRKLLIFKKTVNVSAYCTKSHGNVENPFIGCGLCHEETLKKFQA